MSGSARPLATRQQTFCRPALFAAALATASGLTSKPSTRSGAGAGENAGAYAGAAGAINHEFTAHKLGREQVAFHGVR